MRPSVRVRVIAAMASTLLLLAVGTGKTHEAPHERPRARGQIDPRQAFQFLVLSGAGGHFHSLLASRALKTLFAGTHLGLFRSGDRGVTWRLAAARFSGEEVHQLPWDSARGIIYAATHGQGLLVSRDGGGRWRQHHRGLPGRDLHALALDPQHPSRLYVWVVGHGLFRTDDGGSRWRKVAGSEALAEVESLGVHPLDGRRLYAGTGRGVWISEDEGEHWRLPEGGLPHRTAGLAVPSWESERLFAATLKGVFVGTTKGTAWEPLPPPPAWWGPVTGFAFLDDRPGIVLGVTHEGVVAVREVAGSDWVPLAESRDLGVPPRRGGALLVGMDGERGVAFAAATIRCCRKRMAGRAVRAPPRREPVRS